MYYQIWNKRTEEVEVTCPDYNSALRFIEMMANADLSIKMIPKEDHPLMRRR